MTHLKVLLCLEGKALNKQQVEWLIDSGESKHMTCNQEILHECQQ